MAMIAQVDCSRFEDLAVLYALGELPEHVRAGVEDHVRVCPPCAAVLRRETALAAMLAPAHRSPSEPELSERLLTGCRNKLSRNLDGETAAFRRSAWTSLFSLREWIAALRISPQFHPAWSVAALLVVALVSGLAGWDDIGHWQMLGATVITVSAAPPPAAIRAVPEATSPAPTNQQPATGTVAPDSHVYAATETAMNNAFPRASFGSDAALAYSKPDLAPRASRHEPPLRRPAGLGQSATADAASSGSLAELSRRMETLWWGGVRVDPAEQQKRLVLAQLPEYPEVARRAGIEGPVTLLLHIGKDGAVQDSDLLSGEPVLGRAAAQAVEQWRYSPLRIDGRPVNILTSVTLDFQLR